jgi:Fibronectin type III domain
MFTLLKKSLFFIFLLTILMFSACDEAADLLDDPADDTDPPDAPSHFDAVLEEDDGTIGVTWQDDSDNEDGFILEIRVDGGDWDEEADLSRNQTSYSFEDLIENSDYKFRIHAYNGNGESNSVTSDEISVPFYPPTDLVASSTLTSIILSWEDNSEAEDGYRIFRRKAGVDWAAITDVNDDVVSYTDSDELEEDVTYSYRVAATSGSDLSDYSNEINAQIGLADVLDAPSNLNAEENDATSIILTWTDNSEGEEGFKVQRRAEGTDDYVDLAQTIDADEESFIDSENITESVRYYYRVYAYEGQRVSAYSNVDWAAVGTVNTDYPPEAPEDIEVELVDGNTGVRISWNDESDNEDNFIVQMKPSDQAYETFATLEADSEEITIPDLSPGSYDFRVKAVNEFGSSDYVDTPTVLIPGGGEGPNPPDDLEVEMVGDDHLRITWRDHSEDEVGFRLERRVGEEGDFEERTLLDENIEEFEDWWALTPGTYYFYRVIAYNENGDSAPSNVEGIQFGNDPNEIEAPTDLEVTLHGEGDDIIAILNWVDNSDNEDEFVIERSEDGGNNFDEIGTTTGTGTENHSVFAGETYHYRVYARNSETTSDYSNVAEVTIPGGPSGAPTDLEYTINGTSGSYSVLLSWIDNSDDENEFGVERSMDQGATYTIIGTTYEIEYEDFTVADNAQYSYRVSEFPDSTTEYTNVVDVTIPGGGAGGDTIFVAGFEEFDAGDTFTSPDWNMEDLWDGTSLTIFGINSHSGSKSLDVRNGSGGPMSGFGPNFDAISHGLIEFWVFQPTISEWSAAFSTDGGGTNFLLHMRDFGSIIAFADGDGWHNNGDTYPVGSWYKVAVELNCDTREFSLWVNDVLLSTYVADEAGNTFSNFEFFFWDDNPNEEGVFIDDVTVLSITE